MTALTFRAWWPIEDPSKYSEFSVEIARSEVPRIADEHQATIVGPLVFTTSRGHLVCEAAAVRRVAS